MNIGQEALKCLAKKRRKLSDEQVREVRRHYFHGTKGMRQMAREYGVDERVIRQICRFDTYDD